METRRDCCVFCVCGREGVGIYLGSYQTRLSSEQWLKISRSLCSEEPDLYLCLSAAALTSEKGAEMFATGAFCWVNRIPLEESAPVSAPPSVLKTCARLSPALKLKGCHQRDFTKEDGSAGGTESTTRFQLLLVRLEIQPSRMTAADLTFNSWAIYVDTSWASV